MGKGFNNYMCKKFFHPASADNLKRVWIAQKKAETEKNKQADLRAQYEREQELYNNKALLSKESKDKLELNFMYEPPPGVKKVGENDKDDEEGAEPEYKFEWQKTWGHAPKESYLEKGDEFNEQPFGIQVCQAKCIKCGKYGHMNTDKRCALYGKSLDHDTPIQNVDQNKLLDEMKAEGLAMRYTSWDLKKEVGPNHAMVEEKKGIDRVAQLKSMSKKEKKKLLKELKHMEKAQKKKEKKEKKRQKRGDSEEWEEKTLDHKSGSDSGRGSDEGHDKKKKKRADKEEKPRKRNKEKKRGRSDSSDDRRPVKRERSRSVQRKRDRSDSSDARRPVKRERSRSTERRRDRSDSRERRRDRSNDREDRRRDRSSDDRNDRRRERSHDREKRRERPVSREDRRRERS